jgi:hypothetical protein
MTPGFDPGTAQGAKGPAARISVPALLCVLIVLIGALATLIFLLDYLPTP